jgi:hypothetical protein
LINLEKYRYFVYTVTVHSAENGFELHAGVSMPTTDNAITAYVLLLSADVFLLPAC